MRYFVLILALIAIATVSVAGFRGSKSRRPPIEIIPDMVRQPKLRPQTADALFPDNLSSRQPVAGTISQSRAMQVGDRAVYPFEDSPVNTGRVPGTTNFVELNPFPITAEFLQRGEDRFNITCAACHSRVGDGNGVPRRIQAMPVVGNLHDKRIVELTDGEIFNTISYGKNLMQGYAAHFDARDRWAIVAYVRALQLSWLGAPDDVPESARGALKK